jgi:hypothetical protein
MPTAETTETKPAEEATTTEEIVEPSEGQEEQTSTHDAEVVATDTPTETEDVKPDQVKEDAAPQDAPASKVEENPPAASMPSQPTNPANEFYPANQMQSPHDEPGKKKKRQYIIKNPNRPKRPLSSYNIFFKDERERLVREEMLKDDNADKEKVEELIAMRDKTKAGKRVHRKTHGK